MASVFSTDTGRPIVVRAGKATLKVNGATFIALNVTVQYGREVQMLPSIGKQKIISVGEAQGTFSAETVLAKGANSFEAMGMTGSGCSPFSMTITFNDAACDANGMSVTAHNCIASAVTITAQGGRGFIANGCQATFTALSV